MLSSSGFIILAVAVFIVAVLYSSVGHGGASGYLAVLTLFSFSVSQVAGTALVLNVFVGGLALYSYARAGHLRPALLWPFVLASVPMAFVGGAFRFNEQTYRFVLGAALALTALRLVQRFSPTAGEDSVRPVSLHISLPVGGGIGLLAGMVGLGGGVFLSPVMILMRWATVKQTSAVAAAFIVLNSASGLAGRFIGGAGSGLSLLWLVPIAALGGWIGSHLGANKLPALALRRVLAVVLLVAAAKLFVILH